MLLSPVYSAGGTAAAVRSGADGVYFHVSSGRPGALTMQEAAAAIAFCLRRGVTTLLNIEPHPTDAELADWSPVITELLGMGLSGVILRDAGALRMVRRISLEMPVHIAPDAGAETAREVRFWGALGATLVWLPPRLTRERAAYIIKSSGVACGIVVAGTKCRPARCSLSKNGRGLCKLECTKPFGINEKAEHAILMPEPVTMHNRWDELKAMEAEHFGIFDRMRPADEWIAVTTRMWAEAIRGKRAPDAAKAALARSTGFEPIKFLRRFTQSLTENEVEWPRVPVNIAFFLEYDRPAGLTVEDDAGNQILLEGPKPSLRRDGITEERVRDRLADLVNSPFLINEITCRVGEGLYFPPTAIADMRDRVLEDLTNKRAAKRVKPRPFFPGAKIVGERKPPVITVSVRDFSQLSPALARLNPAVVYVPLMGLTRDLVADFTSAGITLCCRIPRCTGDHERNMLAASLSRAKEIGVNEVLTPNMGYLPMLYDMGFEVRAGLGTDVTNSQTLIEYERLGVKSALLSHELMPRQIAEMSFAVDTELPAYGRMPVMFFDDCLMKRDKICLCDNPHTLNDGTSLRYPLRREYECRSGVYGALKFFMGDRVSELSALGLWALRLNFATENARECVAVTERYKGEGVYAPGEYYQFPKLEPVAN